MKRSTVVLSWLAASLAALTQSPLGAAPAATLSVQADQPTARISPTLWGVFFEDINFAGDGGLYAELVKNRSFEFAEPLMGWKQVEGGSPGSLEVLEHSPLQPNNPHFLRVKIESAKGAFGLANEGFRGMGIRKGATYNFSVNSRVVDGGPLSLVIELASPGGQTLGFTKLTGLGPGWKTSSGSLRVSDTEPQAHLNLIVMGRGTIDLDLVSLFPKETWKNRPNGLRADLVQLLKDLQPGFVRFPGGCIVEGRDLSNRYQWKTTLGGEAERKLIINRWNNEFKHRPTPDYFQSFGLGFFEYFLLSEDLGAEPLPIINCGMACQFNTGQLVPLDQLDPFIQDALDLIEFANGPADSPWGRQRAALGHPAPFHMKLLGVGNEQWGPQYLERYEKFARAIKAKHPALQLVSSAGPDPSGEKFDFLWPKLRALQADLVDEHYYRPPAWFLEQANRYDHYERTGPKVFAGEYAAQSVATCSPDNRNNWECALAEAAFMTGLERNAEVVTMSSYAPLLGHEDAWQWRPNLIWFDNLRSYGTPNYYVQQLFSRNRGDVVLPVQLSEPPSADGKPRLFATACRADTSREIIIKVVNASGEAAPMQLQLKGGRPPATVGTVTVLTAANLADENSLDNPRKVAPATESFRGFAPTFDYTFKPRSLTVLKIKVAP